MVKYVLQYVGYIKLNWGAAQNEFQGDNALEIERLYVLQAYHSQKVGLALSHKAFAIAQEKDVNYIWLGVWEHNHKAIAFYEKMDLSPLTSMFLSWVLICKQIF